MSRIGTPEPVAMTDKPKQTPSSIREELKNKRRKSTNVANSKYHLSPKCISRKTFALKQFINTTTKWQCGHSFSFFLLCFFFVYLLLCKRISAVSSIFIYVSYFNPPCCACNCVWVCVCVFCAFVVLFTQNSLWIMWTMIIPQGAALSPLHLIFIFWPTRNWLNTRTSN